MNANHRYLQRVAADIDHRGVAAVERDVATVVDRARRSGINPVAVSVLADPTQPEIARARAFGLVAGALARVTETPVARPAPVLAVA